MPLLSIHKDEKIMIVELAKIDEITANKWYEYSLQTAKGLLSIMLLQQNGQYHAFENSCPHQGRRMDYAVGQFLTDGVGTLICPAHGAEFNPNSGLCTNGPCKGQSLKSIPIQLNEEAIFAIIQE